MRYFLVEKNAKFCPGQTPVAIVVGIGMRRRYCLQEPPCKYAIGRDLLGTIPRCYNLHGILWIRSGEKDRILLRAIFDDGGDGMTRKACIKYEQGVLGFDGFSQIPNLHHANRPCFELNFTFGRVNASIVSGYEIA